MKLIFSSAFLILVPFLVCGQKKISVEDIYQGVFSQSSVDEIRWMKNGDYYTALDNNRIVQYEISTGAEVNVLVDGNSTNPKINIDDYDFSANEKKLLITTQKRNIYRRSYQANYYIYDLDTQSLEPLSLEGEQSYATFSPDGSAVAFTRLNDLFYVKIDGMREVRVTANGKFNERINGSTDWVYEEEFSITKAFFWSPDSKKLAYLSFDESHVKEYNMQLWSEYELYPYDYRFKYPKAGERNSQVEVFIYDVSDKKTIAVDVGTEKDIYIPRMQWTNDPGTLSITRMNRLQNKLEILHVDALNGKSMVVFTDQSDKYIDIDNLDDLTYLSDKKHFLISSEKTGYKHLYLYKISGEEVRQITSGEYVVTEFIGLKENRNLMRSKVYYQSSETSPLDKTIHQIDISGKNKILLSPQRGTSTVDMSTDFRYFVLNYENASTPLQVSLHRLKSNRAVKIKDLEQNKELQNTVEEYSLSLKEFYTFKSADGRDLNAYMLKPMDFDPSQQYPVLIFQYSGPGSQYVANSWGGGNNFYWHQMLTQQGYVVVVQDSRGTGFRGAEFEKVTYKKLGKYETEDHIEGAKYLKSLPYIDADRIGIWGWSYGGYISSLAMFRGADYFKAGIAVAPVTTWRYYDTVYTERYLQRPQDNPSGYDDNSPLNYAKNLKGNYLLIHGTGDDNVHFQNSISLQNELILHGKQFQSFYYPNRAHGIADYNARVHLYTMMTNFLIKNL